MGEKKEESSKIKIPRFYFLNKYKENDINKDV